MTPETLQRLNDLRMRVVQADEARRAGDVARAAQLEPSTEEIVEALKQARASRTDALARKSSTTLAKVEAEKFKTMDLKELFDA